ncbi:MAG: Septum site-determining protein MinC [Candidatus Erwinia impunctatus]|nr:Septum site-determining protein MinC [Culicoides impunctatus]
MPHTPIDLKGSSFTLSVIHLHQADANAIYQAIQSKIEQAPAFLNNAPVVINVASLDADAEWSAIVKAIGQTSLHVVGVSGCQDDKLKEAIIASGLPLLTEGKAQSPRVPSPAPLREEKIWLPTKVVNTPVRSGQQIYAKNSDLIVSAQVSAGAELIADGNIHIYGVMRGRALAGASGEKNAQIFCTSLSAELISIAGEYWIMDQVPADFFGKAARLFLESGVLTIKTLN